MTRIVLIAHDLRSCHNVGSLLRTAEGLGVKEVWLTGYTPYPMQKNDKRLPHLAQKITKQINKTALGAEDLVNIHRNPDITGAIGDLRAKGYQVWALEQAKSAIRLQKFKPPSKIALLVGNEVIGLEPEALKQCDGALEIPMLGKKESFNVVQAAAMALYQLHDS